MLRKVAGPGREPRPTLRGVTHLAALVVCGGAALPFIRWLPESMRANGTLYAACCLILLFTSTLLHVPNHDTTTARYRCIRRLDHTAIFFFIAGCYALSADAPGISAASYQFVMRLVWSQVAIGSVIVWSAPLTTPKWVRTVPYVTLGWTCLLIFGDLMSAIRTIGLGPLMLLLASGVIFTGCAVVYSMKGPNLVKGVFEYHELMHMMVLTGILLQGTYVTIGIAPFHR